MKKMKNNVIQTFALICLLLISFSVKAELKGKQLAWACFSCHGVEGVSQGPATPVIAGLSDNYLIGAMLSYKYADDLDKAEEIIENDSSLEDVRINQRFSAMMQRIAKAYTLEEIKYIAEYFSQEEFVMIEQTFDKKMAKNGKKRHKKYCDKCHEDWGTSTEDDVGLLAGQWRTYLEYTLEDFTSGDREMPKKMKKKMKKMIKKHGEESLQDLVEFYSSQR